MEHHFGLTEVLEMIFLHRGDVLEPANVKCHLQTLCQLLDHLHNIGIHLLILLNVLMPIYIYAQLNTKCHEVTLNMKLLTIGVT